MTTHVQKLTVRFGKTAASDASVWENAYAGIPGGTLLKGAAQLGDDPPDVNSLDETGVLVKLPHARPAWGNVQAIAIAPDSPIECVDLYINGEGGSSVHRISPSRPFIGTLNESDQLRVVPIRELPYLGWVEGQNTDEATAHSVFWDMTIAPDESLANGSAPPSDVPSVMIPVRLNIYRGNVPAGIAGARAPYHASLAFNTGGGGGAPTMGKPRMFVVTDGRRRFRVAAAHLSIAVVNLSIYGVLPFKSTVGDPDDTFGTDIVPERRIDAYELVTLATIAIGNNLIPSVFDYTPESGNPYVAILVAADYSAESLGDNSGADAKGYFQVDAWDE